MLIPTVLAMLGDNPMQSEFACHVGLTGKFFCHCCWVKGRDADDEGKLPTNTHVPDTASVGSAQSDAGSEKSAGGKHRCQVETLSQLKDRAKFFLMVSMMYSIHTHFQLSKL